MIRACASAARLARLARASARALSAISLDSAGFAALRARGNALVDKTGAIADLLMGDDGMHN